MKKCMTTLKLLLTKITNSNGAHKATCTENIINTCYFLT